MITVSTYSIRTTEMEPAKIHPSYNLQKIQPLFKSKEDYLQFVNTLLNNGNLKKSYECLESLNETQFAHNFYKLPNGEDVINTLLFNTSTKIGIHDELVRQDLNQLLTFEKAVIHGLKHMHCMLDAWWVVYTRLHQVLIYSDCHAIVDQSTEAIKTIEESFATVQEATNTLKHRIENGAPPHVDRFAEITLSNIYQGLCHESDTDAEIAMLEYMTECLKMIKLHKKETKDDDMSMSSFDLDILN